VPQELGFYQEIEFFPPAQFAGALQQVELTFVANPHELFVVLEADKRGGMFSSGGDAFGHFHLSHQEAEVADWASSINGWLSQVAQRGGGMHGYGQHGHHGGHHGRGGMGMGTVVAAGAAGVVGGMVVGEMMDDAFEDFGDFGGE
jgi:sporulation-control protein